MANNIKFNFGSSRLTESTVFIVDAFSGESKKSGKPFYMFKAIVLSNDEKHAFCRDFFCDEDCFKAITDYGYYELEVSLSGNIKSVTPIEAVTI